MPLDLDIPDSEGIVSYCARVSNPSNQTQFDTAAKLLKYCVRNQHWSVFEMVNVVMEIECPRDIARQVLRHRSFSFQEFSQRYADVTQLGEFAIRECRMQDKDNRQNSIESDNLAMQYWWEGAQKRVGDDAKFMYEAALAKGIAKEQARALLPEGMTMSRMYMVGSYRSWIHYLNSRLHMSTQKEHRQIAKDVLVLLREAAPMTMNVFFPKELS